ncbi:glucosamine-6-phosphate deaminase [Niabella drilacis]|uniref:Glucosamine-6-phosphate deaminase n=1 Tax=Niabella drilacis (strain DSM 25811 / CCM 8410 / CCUG 62505 / LMG 26954 / E90) TaxID=1285928 RepID=A0A1G6NXR1_NIADE|nr:glucosamine-6-phosphate deaminase [Niabella drilacis]SDC71955.1 glucosamine-6-phosphate deaminase [Niabella drilacis]
MELIIQEDPHTLGKAAGEKAAALIRDTIAATGKAHIILATGTSQFQTLRQLSAAKDIDWTKVIMFHLDEYIGLPATHPASFRKYLRERFLDKVPPLKASYLINGETDAGAEVRRLNTVMDQHPIDVALVGIGENGHLAFNDPPADFDTEDPYLIVNLDEKCRRQQMDEGWFATPEDVPAQAISMSVKQIMKSQHIICSVPDSRKAQAVKDSVTQPVGPLFPASILQQHPSCRLYLDRHAAALLAPEHP